MILGPIYKFNPKNYHNCPSTQDSKNKMGPPGFEPGSPAPKAGRMSPSYPMAPLLFLIFNNSCERFLVVLKKKAVI